MKYFLYFLFFGTSILTLETYYDYPNEERKLLTKRQSKSIDI